MVDTSSPTMILSLNGANISQISTGQWHSLVLSRNGVVYAFGSNNVSFFWINFRTENLGSVIYQPN